MLLTIFLRKKLIRYFLTNFLLKFKFLHSKKQYKCSTKRKCQDHNRSLVLLNVLLENFQPATPPFPTIRSAKSLVAKHLTPEKWEQLANIKTKTSGFTLAQAIACAVEFNDQVP
jgi:hypothetical protein